MRARPQLGLTTIFSASATLVSMDEDNDSVDER
jgi:hypothetical protein